MSLIIYSVSLANHPIHKNQTSLSVGNDFAILKRMTPLSLIIPMQSSLTVSLPHKSCESELIKHVPFEANLPLIHGNIFLEIFCLVDRISRFDSTNEQSCKTS